MLSKLRARLTYANVMATIAVFIALGGSSYAAIKVTGKNVEDSSLTGKDIKNNSVTGGDVKGIKSGDVTDRSLLEKDFKAGQLPAGAQGAQGPQGPQGPQGGKGDEGDEGDAGAAGATNVRVVTGTFEAVPANGENGAIDVQCGAGERATGGGGVTKGDSSLRLYQSGPPDLDGETPTGWLVSYKDTDNSAGEAAAIAVCASP